MRPFSYQHPRSTMAALALAAQHVARPGEARRPAPARYLAGGTNLLDLMKIGVDHPATLIDIAALRQEHGRIEADESGLSLGALVRMAEAAEHPAVLRDYPAIAQSLQLAASQQLRNMATLGGNVLQRTRCNYFRDPSWPACNKRMPGSGCAAMQGVNRRLAVLGVSEHCIAHYPGDFANVLAAFGAELDLLAPDGTARRIPFEELHRLPGGTPHIETNLQPGELITGFRVPAGPWTRRSLYLKIRDRDSYDFAQASAVVGLDLQDGVVREARIGLGGLVAKPWRAHAAEAALNGQRLDRAVAEAAAAAAFQDAVTHGENAFKPELGRRTLVRALLQAAAMEA
ncbi:xanthine dehydrogenase family protein subunit M [Siccirubricoccus sp. KC 17139]|uniref:Xanthine dehydrogenase family protein subunit M n=1 Tax=Siccirubricoccus soli TaxID=2899147 RepID=A0ABT1DC84_9PROT|nr:xanthine dehydrogenase family protein subunit M [Siccirubricoccus soli]MCO6419551.1 xanthine dehydrogenase family protein subunit M [Siccirubricoccus soli]MCP2685686.1 xanthine dehydrogenase family protein subunit M [Siccirubricoccus soli]